MKLCTINTIHKNKEWLRKGWDQFKTRSRRYFNARPTRYRPAAAASGTSVAEHCVKSLRPRLDCVGASRLIYIF